MSALASPLDHRKNLRASYAALLFSLALFGYPIIGNLKSLLDIESQLPSVLFRLFIALLSLFMFATMGRMRLDRWRLMILLIWCAIVLRLSFDILVVGIDSAVYALQFFMVGSVLPVLALWKLDAYDQKRFALVGFILASVGCLTSLFANYLGAFGESDLTELTGRLSSVSLNAVSLGNLGVSGFLCGLVLLRQAGIGARILITVVIACLLFVSVQTGSKGPILSLAIALLIWAIQRRLSGRLMAVVFAAICLFAMYGNNPLFERLIAMNYDPSTLERIVLIQDSLQQIYSSPWIGSASVELITGYYPHNILLEAMMSFGLPLTAVFIAILVRGLVVSCGLFHTNYDLIALLYIQALVTSQLSSALFADSMLWVCLILILNSKLVVTLESNPRSIIGAKTAELNTNKPIN